MQLKRKAIINWSGGKDSALALYKLQQTKQYNILCLLTSIRKENQRISMHGVRAQLLDAQAKSIGLPVEKIQMPDTPTMKEYEEVMNKAIKKLKHKEASVSVFGDIFLEDLRKYREDQLAKTGLKGVFPLWKIPTNELIKEFIELGFKTITTCVNEKYLDKSFVGRVIDHQFLKDLPKNVDPCGENGEFHTFVFDGPIFANPIAFEKGEVVYKKYTPAKKDDNDDGYDCEPDDDSPFDTGFWYCDLTTS